MDRSPEARRDLPDAGALRMSVSPLAQRLHETIYRLPRGEAQTVLLYASRPDWSADALDKYIAAMSSEERGIALAALIRFVAQIGSAQTLDGDYPPNGADV